MQINAIYHHIILSTFVNIINFGYILLSKSLCNILIRCISKGNAIISSYKSSNFIFVCFFISFKSSIIVLAVSIIIIMAALMVGGYYLNIILCMLFNLWENTYFCLLSTNDGTLYLLGIIGFPLLMCTFACCFCCCGPLFANDNNKIFPYGIV